MEKFTKLFLLLGAYTLFTYTVVPDVQTTLVAIQTGVNKDEIKKLWTISLIGSAAFLYLMYKEGELPS